MRGHWTPFSITCRARGDQLLQLIAFTSSGTCIASKCRNGRIILNLDTTKYRSTTSVQVYNLQFAGAHARP